MKNYYIDKTKERMSFECFILSCGDIGLCQYEKDLFNHIVNNKLSIIKKPFPGSYLVFLANFILWRAISVSNEKILYVNRTDEDVVFCSHIVQATINHLPDESRPTFNKNNNHQKWFKETNSKIKFCTPADTKGQDFTWLIVDDAASINNIGGWYKAWRPLHYGSNAKVVFLSAMSNKEDNWFNKTWTDASIGNSKFSAFQ